MAAPLSNLTMARGLALLFIPALVSAPLADAHAVCAASSWPYLSPASGVPLPPDPHLLLLQAEEDAPLAPMVDGAPAPFHTTRLDETTLLVQVETGRGHELTFDLEEGRVRYPIDPAWKPRESRIAGRVRRTHEWTCSFHDTIAVSIESRAVGFLAEWRDSEPGVVWLPTFNDLAWSPAVSGRTVFAAGRDGPVVAAAPDYALVELGHPNCRQWNVPADLFRRGGTVWLTALHADGSREPLGPVALESEIEIPESVAILDLSDPARQDRRPEPWSPPAPRSIAALALAAAACTLLLFRRRRPTLR